MTKNNDPNRAHDEAQARAEAAAWLARLQSEARGPADEAGFRAWLAQGEVQREAFDRLTAAWELAGGLGDVQPAPVRPPQARWVAAPLAAAACLAVAVIATLVWPRLQPGDLYTTGAGQTLRIAVADGSTVVLDANSRLKVKLTGRRRSLSLEGGRAHFEVAKDARRPFVVTAGEQEVQSIGTVFDVAHAPHNTSVLLIQGKVAVRPRGQDAGGRLMSPGELLTYDARGVRAARPNLAKLTAWQTGQALFDGDTLAAAAAELNRYSRRPIVIADAGVANLRVSGAFKAGATEDFATAVAVLLPIDVHVEPTRILVRTRPSAPPQG